MERRRQRRKTLGQSEFVIPRHLADRVHQLPSCSETLIPMHMPLKTHDHGYVNTSLQSQCRARAWSEPALNDQWGMHWDNIFLTPSLEAQRCLEGGLFALPWPMCVKERFNGGNIVNCTPLFPHNDSCFSKWSRRIKPLKKQTRFGSLLPNKWNKSTLN